MEEFLAEHAPRIAFYSEDRGLVEPSDDDPRWVLVVDPIDGTRPAMAGFEAACVSVALAELGDGTPTMGDVVAGSVVELKSGRTFTPNAAAGSTRRPPVREPRPRPPVLGLRPAGTDAGDRRGDRRADRRLVGRRRHLRPGLGLLRHDADRDRPARRLRRAWAADGRRRPGDARAVRAARRRSGAQQRSLRHRRGRALPRGGGRRDHGRLRSAARESPTAGVGSRVPDLVRRGGERRAAQASSSRSSAGSSASWAGSRHTRAKVRHGQVYRPGGGFCSFRACSPRSPWATSRSPTTPISPAAG